MIAQSAQRHRKSFSASAKHTTVQAISVPSWGASWTRPAPWSIFALSASLTAVSGTDNNGAFFAVLSGQGRPFREPGVESGHTVLACAVGPCNIPLFDGNPERLRVDSDGLEGVAAGGAGRVRPSGDRSEVVPVVVEVEVAVPRSGPAGW